MSIYLDAIRVLEERGWHQGSFKSRGRIAAVCIQGAVGICTDAHMVRDGISWSNEYDKERYNDALNLLELVLHDYYSEFWSLSEWNDRQESTYEDVVLLLKRAHEASEEATNEGVTT